MGVRFPPRSASRQKRLQIDGAVGSITPHFGIALRVYENFTGEFAVQWSLVPEPRGFAQHPVTLRQMGAARREVLQLWTEATEFAHDAYRHRVRAEPTSFHLA